VRPAVGLLAASDERSLGIEARERFAGRADVEAAVERDLSEGDPQLLQFRHGVG
jgi:hypothetical protein